MDGIDDMMKETIAKAVTKKNSSDYEKELTRLMNRLDRIGIRFEDGDISVDEYREKRDEIQRKLRECERLTLQEVSIQLPENWEEIYKDLTNIGKRQFWRTFISEITVTRENKKCLSAQDIKFKS